MEFQISIFFEVSVVLMHLCSLNRLDYGTTQRNEIMRPVTFKALALGKKCSSWVRHLEEAMAKVKLKLMLEAENNLNGTDKGADHHQARPEESKD